MVMPDTVLLPDQHRQAQATCIFFSHHDPAPSMPQQSLQTQPSPPGSDWSLRERRPQPSAMLPACPPGPRQLLAQRGDQPSPPLITLS